MPHETVQYPNTSPEFTGTEVTVHWNKDSHVQLEVVRHVWKPPAPGETGTVAEWDRKKDALVAGWAALTEPPTPTPPPPPYKGFPNGTIKELNGEIAFKVGERHQDSTDGVYSHRTGIWQIMSIPDQLVRESMQPEMPNNMVFDDYVESWPIVWGPGGLLVEHRIYTEVLERGHINKMIRALRRARDVAYGADA